MADLQLKIHTVLSKLEQVPLSDMGKDLRELVQKIDAVAAGLNNEIMPELKNTMIEMKKAAVTAQRLLDSTDSTMASKDSPAQQELREALQEVAMAARSIRILTEYIERNPNALIRGKAEEKP